LVTAVAADGRRDPFEDFDVGNVDSVDDEAKELAADPRLLDVVFDLGRKTRRSEAVAPFLSPSVDVKIGADADEAVVVVDDDVIKAAAVVTVTVDGVGVGGGDVDAVAEADDLRRKRFIFIGVVQSAKLLHVVAFIPILLLLLLLQLLL
jgi:hypothetical protein